ncbi:MAG: hypothetical protein IPO28_12030 [Holophagaceae bacterium]|nr:hypothetical protein [Holophagaceae bacterium]
MRHRRLAPALALLLLAAGCSSEDPRLPANLYEEARKLNLEGRSLEARAMMKQLTERYPESEAAQQAKRDLYLIEAFVNRDIADRQKQVRAAMKRLTDALIRYRAKRSEYPAALGGSWSLNTSISCLRPPGAPLPLPALCHPPHRRTPGQAGTRAAEVQYQAGWLLSGLPGDRPPARG